MPTICCVGRGQAARLIWDGRRTEDAIGSPRQASQLTRRGGASAVEGPLHRVVSEMSETSCLRGSA
ncbi:MAG: hypothetical protein OXT69_02865 [Candidatus Poribacteria bacterium]|nr:hypothetical protein [Candidatus Poribacteria bacterium]